MLSRRNFFAACGAIAGAAIVPVAAARVVTRWQTGVLSHVFCNGRYAMLQGGPLVSNPGGLVLKSGRKAFCYWHGSEWIVACAEVEPLSKKELARLQAQGRIRASSAPGGAGHAWNKKKLAEGQPHAENGG